MGRNGGKVQTWPCNGSHNQNWAFDETDVVGLYRIRTGVNGRCLDADNRFGGGIGTRIQMWDCLGAGQRNQFWWLVNDSGQLWLLSNLDGNCMLADDGWPRGGEVVLWDCPVVQTQWMLRTF